MTSPLGPSEKERIKHVDNQLGDLINEVKEGKEDTGKLFYIEQQLFFCLDTKMSLMM